MKKKYKNPTMDILNILSVQTLLNGSIGRGEGKKDASDADAPHYRYNPADEDDEDDDEEW